MIPPADKRHVENFENARDAIERINNCDRDWGLGCEVLLQALDELGIPPKRFAMAVFHGECEWVK